jgi:hypothetical protein
MFQVADNISTSAFYIAADDWTRKDGKDWGIGKKYGAFRSVEDFATNFLEISQNRCFYEIIRKDRPCKAYLDLEAKVGAMTEQEGRAMCDAVHREWKRRVTTRWPKVVEQCAQSLGHMILNGSRLTAGITFFLKSILENVFLENALLRKCLFLRKLTHFLRKRFWEIFYLEAGP